MPNLTEVLGSIAETAEWVKSGGLLPVGRAAVNAYLKRRSADAQAILFEELRNGGKLPEQVAAEDDGIAVVHGYMRAAWEGRARVNLRLLAKAITGQLRLGSLIADEFYLYAESLAGLSRDEVVLISTLLRYHPTLPDVPEEEMGEREKQSPWLATMAEMEREGWHKDKVAAVAGRCLRSGFVIAQSAWGGLAFKASPMLLDLSKTVDFDDALRRERSGPPFGNVGDRPGDLVGVASESNFGFRQRRFGDIENRQIRVAAGNQVIDQPRRAAADVND